MDLKWIMVVAATLAGSVGAFQGYLRAEGRTIRDDAGRVHLRGIGLGGWMLQEGYMIGTAGFAGTQHEVRARLESLVGVERTEVFYQGWRDSFLVREDVDSLAAWGFNSVRLPMHWNLYMDSGLPVRWKEEGFRRTDSLVAWCKAAGMVVFLDLHAAPGGQGHDRNISDGAPAVPSLWEDADKRTMAVALWRRLAERYAGEASVGGYDLLNETNWGFEGKADNGCADETNAPLRALQVDITRAIREVDPHHMVIIEGNCWGNSYSGILPPWDDNLVVSFHKYWNPTDAGSINPLFQIRDTWNVPLWLGESGENGNEWFRQTLRMLETEGVDWSWWPYKKIESVVGPVSVSTTGGWEAFRTWGDGGARPDPELVASGLEQLVANLRLGRCRVRRDVLDAMFRQVREDSALPWRAIHLPGAWGAEEYDLGADGVAYHDAVSLETDGAGSATWNEGWVFRNDGVDLQWSKEEGTWNVGWTEPGEWLRYTVEVDSTADFVLVARVAGPGGRMDVSVDGVPSATVPVTPTAGWTTWADARTGAFRLDSGRRVLRLSMLESGFNLAGLRVVPATVACIEDGKCPASAPVREGGAGRLVREGRGWRWTGVDATEMEVRDVVGRVLHRGVVSAGGRIPLEGAARGMILVRVGERSKMVAAP
ncbi:MAG: cellulase family glycosylhydrolase [Fibrobacteria bacterium]|nr:cellulase family glycosylhydrolase [Fibrobacteria bacterium]